MPNQICACPECTCDVRSGHAVEQNGQYYCSEACASGHTTAKGCDHQTCPC
jgi:metallothionein